MNRKKPRPITVLIPDYTVSDIGTMINNVYLQMAIACKAAENPHVALEHISENAPYVYYSAFSKNINTNRIAIKTLKKQYVFLKNLISAGTHVFAKAVLETYGFEAVVKDDMFIDYDNIEFCKSKIICSWNKYAKSDCGDNALKELKSELKSICNESGVYPKVLDSNIQISTVNEILAFAWELNSKQVKAFDL